MAIKTKLIQNVSIDKKNVLKTKLINKDEEKLKPIITDENGKEIVDDTLIEMTDKDVSFRKPADAELPPQPKPKLDVK